MGFIPQKAIIVPASLPACAFATRRARAYMFIYNTRKLIVISSVQFSMDDVSEWKAYIYINRVRRRLLE